MDLARTPAGRRVLFGAYYFTEGAPIGFLWWCLPSLLAARGAPPDRIGGLLAWLVVPWAFKWAWAPLVDLLQGPRFTLRAWIGCAQAGMALTLLPLLAADDLLLSEWLVPCLLAHAVCAATQDVAIDALMIRTTWEGERGQLSGWMQLGMLGARGAFGGGALLWLAGGAQDTANGRGRVLVWALLAVVAAGLVLAASYRAPAPPSRERGARAASLRAHLRAAAGRRNTWIGLAFAATGGAGFEALGGFAGPLLTERSGGDTELAGWFFLLPALGATALGGLLGGTWADRVGPRRGTVGAGLALGAALLASSALIALLPDATRGLLPAFGAVYLAIGAFTAASYALFMRWTDPDLGATQFSAFMGATNLCESWAVGVAGFWIVGVGHGATFAALALIGLAALALVTLSAEGAPDGRR